MGLLVKLEAILAAAVLSAGCYSGARVCNSSTVNQYRLNDNSGRLQRCEEAKTTSGETIYTFVPVDVSTRGRCIELTKDYLDYNIVKCQTTSSSQSGTQPSAQDFMQWNTGSKSRGKDRSPTVDRGSIPFYPGR